MYLATARQLFRILLSLSAMRAWVPGSRFKRYRPGQTGLELCNPGIRDWLNSWKHASWWLLQI